MKRREPKPLSPVEARLAGMNKHTLRALLQTITTASVPAIFRADEGALRSAAKTYIYQGKLSPETVLNFQEVTL